MAGELAPARDGSLTHAADLTDDASIERCSPRSARRWGAPDIVVNNAGIYPSGFLLDIDAAEWDRIFDINLRAPFLLSRGFARQMIAQGVQGAIINISSGAARKMRRDRRALLHLEDGARPADQGLRARARRVRHPGQRGRARLCAGQHRQPPDRGACRYGAGRHPARPRDRAPRTSANAILYLWSAAADYVTGATLTVDGGNSIGSLEVYQDKKQPL